MTIPAGDPPFEALLDHIKKSRGFDFTGYKRSSLMRRVQKRMSEVGAEDYSRYIDYLEVHPQELNLLFNTILINVTSFFRDQPAWEYIREHIIPQIIQGEDKIRVWSTGCATGQEAYSIAMLLCEALGEHRLHERVKIYATDVDEDALQTARQATYEPRQLIDLPPYLRDRYFTSVGGAEAFRMDIRRLVIFGRHDLVQDAPIPKLDLLLCRNTLMYLNADTQSRILARLHFALKPSGYLFLGRAEMLLSHANLFEPIDLQNRIFAKVVKTNLRDRLLVHAQASDSDPVSLEDRIKLKEAALEKAQLGLAVIDDRGFLVVANGKCREMFAVSLADVGKPFKDLELSYRPVDLRSSIEKCMTERRCIQLDKIPNTRGAKIAYLQARVLPLLDGGDRLLGTSIVFDDITNVLVLNDELRSIHEEFETTNEELESTNEELETTNEELQSTNEELETTNEELQSTNEELETTNAELQSTNEELETTNSQLRHLTIEVEATNSFLQNVLTSLRHGIVVFDKQGRISIWNKQCEELWGVRAEEATGKDFFSLDIGLPMELLRERLDKQSHNQRPEHIVFDAINRRGKPFKCLIRVNPVVGVRAERGTVLLFEEAKDSHGQLS